MTGGLTQTDGGQIIGSTNVNVTKYTAPSGALVFAPGTNYWSRGLALDGEGFGEPNLTIQQATANVFEDMGVIPQTPAANLVFGAPPPTPRPPAPAGFASPSKTDTSISLSWTAVTGVDGYNVYRSDTPRSGGLPLGTKVNPALISGTTFTDTGLAATTVYYYIVTAVKSGLESTSSNELELATLSTGPAPTSSWINVGGPAYTASAGASFVADTSYFAGGNVRSTGTRSPARRTRRCTRTSAGEPSATRSRSRTAPTTSRSTSRRRSSRLAAACTGKRIFGMDIVDTPTSPDISNLDICGLVGPNAALTRTISNVAVSDGILNIQSVPGFADDPVLSALEVVPALRRRRRPPLPAIRAFRRP